MLCFQLWISNHPDLTAEQMFARPRLEAVLRANMDDFTDEEKKLAEMTLEQLREQIF